MLFYRIISNFIPYFFFFLHTARTKELHFFDDRYHKINWSAPVDELYEKYLKKFPKLDNTHLFFEATPNYAAGYALERMHRIIPHTRLIYIVRKPSSRSVSQFFMVPSIFQIPPPDFIPTLFLPESDRLHSKGIFSNTFRPALPSRRSGKQMWRC